VPIYEYSCPACDHEFEVLIRSTERAKCPTCGSVKIERLLSVPAAHSGNSASLPVCQPSAGPMCPSGRCRTGMCDMD
jgi:putative FmdB family regulatory protein